jgi:outer membrane protein assembly factor BamB
MYRYSNRASALAFSVALGLLATPALSKSTDEDATTYQINAAHDGHVDFAAGFNAPLVRAWTYDTGDDSGSYPVIGGGMLFFVGNGNDAFAFDLASGSRVWEHLLTGGNSPAYADGTIVFASTSGAVTALKARTGKQRWSASLNDNGGLSYPVAAQGMVFTAGYTLTALDGKTGATNWSKSLSPSSATVTYGDGGLYVGSGCDYTKYAPNGDLIWSVNGNCSGYEDNVAYFNKHLYVYDYYQNNPILGTKDGSQTGFFPGSTLPVFYTSNNHSYELVTSNGKIYCLDLKTGNVVWSFQTSGNYALPIAINGHPIVASYSTLYMLDGVSGAPLWSDNVGSEINYMNAGDGALAITTGGKIIVYKPQ